MCRISQFEIEKIVNKVFPGTGGTFLEIGCWDGEHISNTLYLEKEKQWKGVCVDPFPKNFANRDCTVINRAVSRNGEPRDFRRVYFDKRDHGDVSYLSGFEDSIDVYREFIREYCHSDVVKIKTITIEELYRTVPLPLHIDFLSIDTEGSEKEIIKSIDFKRFTYGLIIIEHNKDKETIGYITQILSQAGYSLYKELMIDNVYINNIVYDNNV